MTGTLQRQIRVHKSLRCTADPVGRVADCFVISRSTVRFCSVAYVTSLALSISCKTPSRRNGATSSFIRNQSRSGGVSAAGAAFRVSVPLGGGRLILPYPFSRRPSLSLSTREVR